MQPPQKSPSLRPFKQRKSLATRREEVAGIRAKFPSKIPVVVERYPREKFLPLLDKTKFLVPQELTMTQFLSILRTLRLLLRSAKGYLVESEGNYRRIEVRNRSDSCQTPGCWRSRLVLRTTEAFYLLVNNKSLVSTSVTMAEIYRDYKDKDGFVYMTYASQEMFGCFGLAASRDCSCSGTGPAIISGSCQGEFVF
ncbi:microtubule-associated proteins 1A/1B light chain 3C isoform X1 [Choloepus didactylus]|uniref:microtubule-associated proteins 1A/1B light chain 3C isoform X1 n=1 Tax=Choloepus didactylus TaxID=27675 RepID=UPI00189C5AE2|nr:microtubule-associated proteins 1A/1B light chain 3C isoform X1 [Choloepus didactylus]